MRLLATGRAVRAAWTPCSSSLKTQTLRHCNGRRLSTGARLPLSVDGVSYPTDAWTNVPPSIISAVPRRLHLQPDHPIALTRQIIEAHFPAPAYRAYNDLPPVVSVGQNFDSLGFPADHPGRSRSDTYYVNESTVLRTHTSAHQADVFRENASPGFLISADVYRRDAIDRSHYPVFHQMEGARMWDTSAGDVTDAVRADLAALPAHDMVVEDPNPTTHPTRNPLQAQHHTLEEIEAISAHLKRSLELVIGDILTRARMALPSQACSASPLRVRWVEAYFPFTSPSWELEVFWNGAWLELLGCGVVSQNIPAAAGLPKHHGWAFGLGLERIAMLLFSIPDIRLFWSRDARFLSQFRASDPTAVFVPFSRHPACYKDVAFWLPPRSADGAGVHENDVMELVRETAGDAVESVERLDAFAHPKTGRRSLCYRVNYRSLERTLTNTEANALHESLRQALVDRMGVELR
ncbi:MAG: hypothetical protein M1832_004002 [Thelocarpon impressellum]|nr:MAG: hypothetical protein M1832_004002 [Thelocarpon impressellum]